MTKRTYGLLASVIGLGAWLYARRRASSSNTSGDYTHGNHRVRERGTVIFDNTPTAAELPGEA